MFKKIKVYPFLSLTAVPMIGAYNKVDIITEPEESLIYEKYGLKCYSKSKVFLSNAQVAFTEDWKNIYTSSKYLHEVIEYVDKFIELNKWFFNRHIAKEIIKKL